MRKLRLGAMPTLFSQEHTSPTQEQTDFAGVKLEGPF